MGPFAMKNEGSLNDLLGRSGITPLFCFWREVPHVTTMSENIFLKYKLVLEIKMADDK